MEKKSKDRIKKKKKLFSAVSVRVCGWGNMGVWAGQYTSVLSLSLFFCLSLSLYSSLNI